MRMITKKDPRTGEMRRQAVPLKGDKRDLIDTLQIAIGATSDAY